MPPLDLTAELGAARAVGIDAACLAAEREAKLPAGLLLALGSRETGCRNIAGDGGHGRGVFQIDDRFHAAWLAAHGAGDPGAVPPVADAARYAATLLAANLEYGRGHGVPAAQLLKFALSAYNAGAGGALAGLEQGDSDRRTAHGDYGRDVLARLEAVRRWLERTGVDPAAARPLLRPGARGPAVAQLKARLAAWYAANPPRPRFSTGAIYGPAAVEAVERFQRAAGLAPDGVVGPATWAALERVPQRPPARARQVPPLPAEVSFVADAYPAPQTWNGLQPWIVPQAKAICERFGLRASAGHGGSPPHARRSDHCWGGAVDLAGPLEALVACNLWADRYRADPHREGAVFRWVGGPAADADGPEAGHLDHVHLSWFRSGPATSVFDTPEFAT